MRIASLLGAALLSLGLLAGCRDDPERGVPATPAGGPAPAPVSEAVEAAKAGADPEARLRTAAPAEEGAPSRPSQPSAPGRLEAGQDAPQLTLELHDGETVSVPAAAKAGVLFVYFYPKDDTPGCTVEAQGLRDVYPDLREAGVTVIGVSTQGAASHQAFIDAHDLPFPLAVNGEAAAQAFGVPMRAGMTARHSFLLADGKVARVWREVDPSEHAGEVLEAARARG